jgi:hypothetical protein
MQVGSAVNLPASRCTACGHLVDAASCVGNDGAPSPGDFTVCIACGHIMGFAADLTLRELTGDEIVAAAGDRRLLAIQWARGKITGKKK